jgi:2,4-diketo-3-deoxy-L-fuconate hydrolase
MKLLRIRQNQQIIPAILDANGQPRDLRGQLNDLSGETVGDETLALLRAVDVASLNKITGDYRIAPCVAAPPRFFCIGLNYSDHAREAGMAIPQHPILFMKVCDATGANDPVPLPRGSEKMDWEVELGVVLGLGGQHIDEADALDHVAGYCVVNDLSERAFQIEQGGQWVKGKSCDGFGPIGPWLVTRDEIPDPQNLDLFLDLNGERRQSGNTGTMVFTVAQIISHLSRFITLKAGDLISTGTPPGVGMGCKPPRFLRPGDEMRLGVAGLGEQVQKVVA